MESTQESAQSAAAAAVDAVSNGNVNAARVTNCVQRFIPESWLNAVLPDAFKYAAVVKGVFIMNSGATVKMRREMDAGQRNLEALQQYHAWVENLCYCYPQAAINKYMMYTTKTLRKEYTGRDVYRKFSDGLEKFQNVFMPTWNAVLAEGISGKTWPDIWARFVAKLFSSKPELVNAENLPLLEFKHPWLLCFKFLGPPCEKLFPGQTCHEIFCEANLLSSRGTGTRKRKIQKLSRKDEREDFARRTKSALKHAVQDKKDRHLGTIKNNCLQMHTLMRGVEMFAANRKSEFNMLHQALALYAADDPRAEELKSKMFALLSSKKTMGEQIADVQHHLTVDLTGAESEDVFPREEIDPIHAARNTLQPLPQPLPQVLAPPDMTPTPISPPVLVETPSGQQDATAHRHQVNSDACLYALIF